MNQSDTDKISMLTGVRPEPPADAEQIRERVRARLEVAIAAAEAGHATPQPRRHRRVVLGLAGATAVASAVIAVPAVLPGGGSSLVTKAWAVDRESNGTITVTINKTLSHQARLQRVLRADGVRVFVRSLHDCQEWVPHGGWRGILHQSQALLFPEPGNHDKDFRQIVIRPSYLKPNEYILIAGSTTSYGLSMQLWVAPGRRPHCARGQRIKISPGPSASVSAPVSASASASG